MIYYQQYSPMLFCKDLEILHEGGCTLYEVRRALGRNARRKACAEPRMAYERNAICTKTIGSNSYNETYSNPFQVLCHRPRGLKEKVGGACGCPAQRSCEKAHEIQMALRSASITDRVKFIVCGSDRRTYRSQYHLECSKRFNNKCKYLRF